MATRSPRRTRARASTSAVAHATATVAVGERTAEPPAHSLESSQTHRRQHQTAQRTRPHTQYQAGAADAADAVQLESLAPLSLQPAAPATSNTAGAGPGPGPGAGSFLTLEPLASASSSATGSVAESDINEGKSVPEGAVRPKRERKKKEGHMPRPPNSWILYRSAQIEKLKRDSDLSRRPQSEVSRLIGYMWRDESPEVRKFYEEQAAIRKAEHAALYPNYVYAPVRKDSKNKTSAATGSTATGAVAARADDNAPAGSSSSAKAQRPAQKRGRAFTSPNLAHEARARSARQGHEAHAISVDPMAIAGSAGAERSSMEGRSWASEQSEMSDYSEFSHSLDSRHGNAATLDAWHEFHHSALNFYPQQHPQTHAWTATGSLPETTTWNLPPLSAPAAMARFSFDFPPQAPVLLDAEPAPPPSASNATADGWSIYSPQSAVPTAATSVDPQSWSEQQQQPQQFGSDVDSAGSPWTHGGSLPSPSFVGSIDGQPYAPLPPAYGTSTSFPGHQQMPFARQGIYAHQQPAQAEWNRQQHQGPYRQ